MEYWRILLARKIYDSRVGKSILIQFSKLKTMDTTKTARH